MKSLYLDGRQPMRIVRDGDSLQVSVDGQAPRRYPFRLLARVFLLGDPPMAASVLYALAAAGTHVTLLDRKGNACGYLAPFRQKRLRAKDHLSLFLQLPDWQERWQDWIRSRERKEVLALFPEIGITRPTDLRPDSVRTYLQERLGIPVAASVRRRTSFVMSEVARALAVNEVYSPEASAELDIARRVGSVLAWRLWTWPVPSTGPVPWREEVRWWEERQAAERMRARRIVLEMLYWIRSETWRMENGARG